MDKRFRPRILYLVHRVPYPPDKGDRIRAFQLLKYLAQRADVYLACLADEPVQPQVLEVLSQYARRVAVVPLGRRSRWIRALGSLALGRTVTEGAFSVRELRTILRAWTQDTPFDAALASASSMVPYLRLGQLSEVPAVIDLVDVDSQKWLDYAAASRGPRAWLYRLEGKRLRRLEANLPRWARAVTLVSEAEADLCRRFCAPGEVQAVLNGVDLEYFRPQPLQPVEPSCAFVGAFDYRPNVEGACWFCDEVWPEIRRQRPDARLYLVGRRPVAKVRSLAAIPGVEVVGQVPDVRPYVARATACVVPLHIARGVQNKVLEALAMAKAVIASPAALVGLGVEPAVHLLAAHTPAEWVEAVLRLYTDADLRSQLGSAGRRYVETFHRWDRCLEPLGKLLGLPGEPAGAAPATSLFTGPGPALGLAVGKSS
jgi:sugar transferase (PEP-CTERM/EpsH1 system associated)